jgi:chromosome segregation ATPase
MKRVLLALVVLISLSLCGVCVLQWQREARLRGRITGLVKQLESENKLRIQAEEKVVEYGREIERLNSLRTEIESKLLTSTEELRDRTVDQTARGISIAVLMNEAILAGSKLEAMEKISGKTTDAIKQRNEEVAAQNAAIEKANALMKQLVTERDEAISKLNARTLEFNELAEKYNKLGKSR